MKRLAVAVTAMALATGAGQAANLLLDTPAVDYTGSFSDWSGFYAGVVGGYAVGTGISTSTVTGRASNINLNGAALGVTAGFNHQVDNFVLGAEGELLWSGVNGTGLCANTAYTCSGSIGWLGSIRGRVGVANGSWLVYGNLGLAAGGFSAATIPAVAATTGTFSGVALGWTAGGGVEYALSESTSIKAEYAYYDLGARAPAGTVDGIAIDLRAQVHTVKVGLNFGF